MTLVPKWKYGWRKLVVLLAVLAFAIPCGMSQICSMHDRSLVRDMTTRMKTLCVGRLLIDVPFDAVVRTRGERIDGFAIETIEETEDAFALRMTAREYEIAARGPATDGTGGMVEARSLPVQQLNGRTFIHGLNRGHLMAGERRIDDEFVAVESHAHRGGISVSLSANYKSSADARRAEALLARWRPRGEDEIPVEPGFCGWRTAFMEPIPRHQTEHIEVAIGLPDHPEIAFMLSSMPGGRADSSLLARAAKTDADGSIIEWMMVGKLRRGKRSINGFAGEEVLEDIRELNLAATYSFMWESNGVAGDVAQPFLYLELQGGVNPRSGGKPVDTTLHEDAVLVLWDRISSSIRLRPSAPAG